MKMLGCIEGHEVIVMVDPGATHNFISLETVKKLGVPVLPSKEYGVSLGTGDSVMGIGLCKSVVLELQGIVIIENFLPLELGNSDVILGIQWLEKLGTMTTNWKTQTLRFQFGADTVTLQGDTWLGRSCIFLKAMLRNLKKEGSGYLVEFNYLHTPAEVQKADEEGVKQSPDFLREVLSKYNQVFEMPLGLPPKRNLEHAIVLQEGANPVSIRPYRHPQIQKGERETDQRHVESRHYSAVHQPFFEPDEEKRLILALLRRLSGT